MCGICGSAYSDPSRPADVEGLRRMTHSLVHRGPDSEGFHLAPGVGLGVRRLSIIDLASGDQPIANEDESVAVVCNGEVYNFVELREELQAAGHRFRTNSDVEVIVHLYEDLGTGAIERLRGMFAFALWDATRRLLLLGRDRLGIKPLHYTVSGEQICFGSEVKALLAGGAVQPRLDARALADVFSMGFVRGPRTLFAGVRCLPPGHYLLYQSGQLLLHQYWDVRFPKISEPEERLSGREWAEALLAKLRESVCLHMRSDVEVGAWLSGGLDSSAVAALARQYAPGPLRVFTLAFENSRLNELGRKTLPDFPEFDLAAETATCRTSDLALLPTAIWHGEDVTATCIEIPRMMTGELAARTVKVVLTGEGADEVFGGYGYFKLDKLLRPFGALPSGLRQAVLPLGMAGPRTWRHAVEVLAGSAETDLERYRNVLGVQRLMRVDGLLSTNMRQALTETPEDGDLPHPDGFRYWHPLAQLQYYDLKMRLPDYIEHNLDRSTMAHSVEARVPFLDHDVVEFCARIPPRLKMRGLREKHILREAMRGLLPPEIARRRKQGLRSPVGDWLRAPLPDFAMELLSARALRDKGYFEPHAVERLLARRSVPTGGLPLLAVIAVQVWDELFVRGRRELVGTG